MFFCSSLLSKYITNSHYHFPPVLLEQRSKAINCGFLSGPMNNCLLNNFSTSETCFLSVLYLLPSQWHRDTGNGSRSVHPGCFFCCCSSRGVLPLLQRGVPPWERALRGLSSCVSRSHNNSSPSLHEVQHLRHGLA